MGLRHLIDYLGDPELEEIDAVQLRKYFNHLKVEHKPKRLNGNTDPLSPSSIEKAWSAIRSFYNWAEVELLIERPDNRIPRPKYNQPEIVPFSEKEIHGILKACDYTRKAQTKEGKTPFKMRRPTAARDKAIVMLLLDTGLRASELCRLDVGDVNLDNGKVHVRDFGTGQKTKGRTAAIGMATRKAIWAYLNQRQQKFDDDPLLLSKNGYNRMNRGSLRKVIKELGDQAGIEKCYPHKFRHTMAIMYLRNGGDVFTLQEILGHSSLEMVKKYVRISDVDVSAAHRRASPVDRLKR